ncbi:alpha-defensin 1-like [Desmodus rotundus]|uniref:alpha-defensin 1-like n=1 Tax=Desmodus rotundus TaxID=9430 RepID=UPI0023818E14|nr:alpha-defensin 1-like [Desmodus rotundus]
MRTLTLLAALLLLAFQARAQTLQETADQVPAQDQPGVKDKELLGDEDQDQPEDEDQELLGDEDQDQPEDEDQDVAISFTGEERTTRQLTGLDIAKEVIKRCRCRRRRRCRHNKVNKTLERLSGTCKVFGRRYRLCCK